MKIYSSFNSLLIFNFIFQIKKKKLRKRKTREKLSKKEKQKNREENCVKINIDLMKMDQKM